MALTAYRSRRVRQPQGAVRPADGWLYAEIPAGISLTPTSYATSVGPGAAGMALQLPDLQQFATYTNQPDPRVLQCVGDFTCAITFSRQASTSYYPPIWRRATTDFALTTGRGGWSYEPGGAPYFFWRNAADSAWVELHPAIVKGIGEINTWVAQRSGSTLSIWCDGALVATTSTGIVDGQANPTAPVGFGNQQLGSQSCGTNVYMVGWTSSSAVNAASASANPWQLFQPRRVWAPIQAAATGIPTLSAATVFGITSSGATPRVTLTF